LQFVDENLQNPISIEKLCRIAGLSRARFHALFQLAFDCGPQHYIKTMRLEPSARLLIRSNEKLDAIAFRCGFSDGFYLIHAFKLNYGISPKIFRKQATQDLP
jgi:transcriptional regulator GlxA family with amidase domain